MIIHGRTISRALPAREYDSRVIFIGSRPVAIQLFSPAVLVLSTACQAHSVLAGAYLEFEVSGHVVARSG
jgi:hypothetical protein